MPDIVTDPIEGSFVVPKIPIGIVNVEVVGSYGSRGSTTYAATGEIRTEQRRQVSTVYYKSDPLAQTFTLSEGRHIAGVDLWFKNAGTKKTYVQIRETLVGIPGRAVFAEGRINATDIKVDGTSTRVLFDSPIWIEANAEFALVLMTDDANTSVAVAELGKFDAVHNALISKQAYQVGVLLSSSNASTWTPHQELDLTFRLLACKFTETEHLIDLGTIVADGNTDIITLANVERVSSTTNCEFEYTDVDGNNYTLSEDMPVALKSAITGNLSLKARLKGDSKRSPVLFPGVQVVLGKIASDGEYVTRAITAGNGVKVSVTFDVYRPGSSEVKVYVQNTDSTWTLVLLTGGSQIGDGWEECTHIFNNFSGASVRVKLVLKGSTLYRPKVTNLKVIVV